MSNQRYKVELTPRVPQAPAAEVLLTVSTLAGGDRRVACAHFALPGRRATFVKSVDFDEGKVIVDFDEADGFLGLEVLGLAETPDEVPELMQFIEDNEIPLLSAAIYTTMACWLDLRDMLRDEDAKRRTFRANLDARWGDASSRLRGILGATDSRELAHTWSTTP